MTTPRWTYEEVNKLYTLPFAKLMHQAVNMHAKYFANDEIELCSLLSVKTGACPEDCGYCNQSAHFQKQTNLTKEKLLSVAEVIKQAQQAKSSGAKRFCMGAAWRNPPKKDFPKILEMIKEVKEIGLETCVTLGMLDEEQAYDLKNAGLDFYNHNLDTSPNYYKKIISTRTYDDRLDTLEKVRKAGIHVCCGGIIGMGETIEDRLELLLQLANLPEPPKSVPINRLLPFNGTPLVNAEPIDDLEFIKIIALTRIMMPQAMIRLSAGRIFMSRETQILCFLAGANSMWLGDKLLTGKNPEKDQDMQMLKQLGLKSNAKC